MDRKESFVLVCRARPSQGDLRLEIGLFDLREADFGGTSRPADRKEPMRFSVRLRIHSKLVVTREKLGSGAGGDVQEMQSILQQFLEDSKDGVEVTLPNASKRQQGRSTSHNARTLNRVLWLTAAKVWNLHQESCRLRHAEVFAEHRASQWPCRLWVSPRARRVAMSCFPGRTKKRDKTRCHIVWALSQVTVPKQSQP